MTPSVISRPHHASFPEPGRAGIRDASNLRFTKHPATQLDVQPISRDVSGLQSDVTAIDDGNPLQDGLPSCQAIRQAAVGRSTCIKSGAFRGSTGRFPGPGTAHLSRISPPVDPLGRGVLVSEPTVVPAHVGVLVLLDNQIDLAYERRQWLRLVGAASGYLVLGGVLGWAIAQVLISLGIAEWIWRAEQFLGFDLDTALPFLGLTVRLDRSSD